MSKKWVLVIHGGAGNVPSVDAKKEIKAKEKLNQALLAGEKILSAGETALDAVIAAVKVMESTKWFNAGKGSVCTKTGEVEMDASVMEGHTLRAGACAGVRRVKHPVELARAIMEESPHVMLIGEGAEQFAKNKDLEFVVPTEYFANLRGKTNSYSVAFETSNNNTSTNGTKYGTVGAVALDMHGNLAAATSTGGTRDKLPGRVGDSPVIGAGTYADDSCAVSCTGVGEVFIRSAVAHDVVARYKYLKQSVVEASKHILFEELPKLPRGEGGIIAVSKDGTYSMQFNTNVMYRGVVTSSGHKQVEIY